MKSSLAALATALAVGTACSGERPATPAAPDRQTRAAPAGAPTGEPPPTALSATVASGCFTDCGGETTPELVAAVRTRALDAQRCYDAALKRQPSLSGRIVIGLQITSEGAVCATRIVDRQIADPELAACIREIFLGLRLPPPAGGCVDVALPLNLVRHDAADAGTDGG